MSDTAIESAVSLPVPPCGRLWLRRPRLVWQLISLFVILRLSAVLLAAAELTFRAAGEDPRADGVDVAGSRFTFFEVEAAPGGEQTRINQPAGGPLDPRRFTEGIKSCTD